jgi:hypothetical protein
VVLRLLPDGSLDPTFAEDGVFLSTFGLSPSPYAESTEAIVGASGVAIDGENRVVIAASQFLAPAGQHCQAPFHQFIARLDAAATSTRRSARAGCTTPGPTRASWSQPSTPLVASIS